MKTFLKNIKKIRKKLYSKKERINFWKNNEKKFTKNIQKIVKKVKLPKGWKIFISPIEVSVFDASSRTFTKCTASLFIVSFLKSFVQYSIVTSIPFPFSDAIRLRSSFEISDSYLTGLILSPVISSSLFVSIF